MVPVVGGAAGGTAPDAPARDRIAHDIDSTLFVEAGAGAGKTSSLVKRIVNLVREDVSVTGIAAITFTEKAAAQTGLPERQIFETLLQREKLGSTGVGAGVGIGGAGSVAGLHIPTALRRTLVGSRWPLCWQWDRASG